MCTFGSHFNLSIQMGHYPDWGAFHGRDAYYGTSTARSEGGAQMLSTRHLC